MRLSLSTAAVIAAVAVVIAVAVVVTSLIGLMISGIDYEIITGGMVIARITASITVDVDIKVIFFSSHGGSR